MERLFSEARKGVVIVVSWSVLLASITGQALFRQGLLGPLELILLAAVSGLGGVLFADLGRAILGYFASIVTAYAIVYLLAILPSLIGMVTGVDAFFLQELWIGIMVRALFPFPFIGLLVASVLGAALGERYV